MFIYFTDTAQQETNTCILERKQNVNMFAEHYLLQKIEKTQYYTFINPKGRVSCTFIVYNNAAITFVTILTSSPITANNLPLTAECMAILNNMIIYFGIIIF